MQFIDRTGKVAYLLGSLGFGGILSGTAEARVFSYLAAVIGQIFLTVLIARIVGLHISQRNQH